MSPSNVTGVTSSVRHDGNDTVLRFTPTNPLRGGSYFNLVYTFNLVGKDNWGNVSSMLQNNQFQVKAKATFYDKDHLKVKDLGELSTGFKEVFNAVDIGTRMNNGQIVAVDSNNNGIVDNDEKGSLSFFVFTGAKASDDSRILNDFHSTGTGVFDGRHVNGLGNTMPSNRIIAPVSTYHYNIPKKQGLTLSQASKDLGWYEDASGYHLTVTRETNPLSGDSTSNLNTHTNYVPLILDIEENANVVDIKGNQTLSVTGVYTKTDGTTYTNTQQLNYNVDIPTTPPTEGILSLTHRYITDSEIIKSYGRSTYISSIGLGNSASTDTNYPLDNYTLRITTNNDTEFFNEVSYSGRSYDTLFANGGEVDIYDDATNDLLMTLTANTQHDRLPIDENKQVKTLRFVFKNINLNKNSTLSFPTDNLSWITQTFYANWDTIYNDSSIKALPTKTTATLANRALSYHTSQTSNGTLGRKIYQVNMIDDNNITTTATRYNRGFTQLYTLTDTATNARGGHDTRTAHEKTLAAFTGKLYQAYLVDPNLKLSDTDWTVYYNYNNSGKDLYVENKPVTPEGDPINQNVLQFANPHVKNGTYDITQIGFWAETDPNLVPTDGINLGEINVDGQTINVTTANSVSSTWTVTLTASETSGVVSKVKPNEATVYGFNTNEHHIDDNIDFEIAYSNVATNDLANVNVITSLPRENDKQLDSLGHNRQSQFDVYLTQPVTAPEGWKAVYTTSSGTAAQIDANTWLEADQVSDWSSITAIKFVATQPVTAGTHVKFHIEDAIIGTNATQGESAFLSSASSTGASSFIESNNVLIQMKQAIDDGTVTVKYVDENGHVIAEDKTIQNDIKSDYDVSDKQTYYPQFITGTNGYAYEFVNTSDNSAANKGVFTTDEQVITHIYKLVPQHADFTFNDVTNADNPRQLGDVDATQGSPETVIAYNTQQRINNYLKQGYEVVSNPFVDNETTYDNDRTVDQHFVISLQQRIVPVTKEKQPNEPVDSNHPHTPVYPNSISELADLEKTVTRKIVYKYIDENGEEAFNTVTQSVTFTREAFVNLVTGEITYTDWATPQTLEPVNSPNINGYTPNYLSVPEQLVDNNSQDTLITVVYTPNDQQATITYIDDTTGQVLDQVDTVVGKTQTEIAYSTASRISTYENNGYEVVSNEFVSPVNYDADDTVDQAFRVVLRHKMVTVTPDNPVHPKTNEPLELSKTITRTVHYHYSNGSTALPSIVQSVTFTRQATVDLVTGEVTYSDWTTEYAMLDSITSPTLTGYFVSGNVEQKMVTVLDDEFVDTIVYTKQRVSATPKLVTQKELPKTGQSTNHFVALGTALLSFSLLTAFKRKKDNQ